MRWFVLTLIAAAGWWAVSPANAAACSSLQIMRCAANQRGHAEQRDGRCVCVIYEWIPRRVTNAADGDVGIVPVVGNDAGSPTVRAVMSAVGQNHRHAVMFYDSGRRIRHTTMYDDSDHIRTRQPVIGAVRLDPDDLRNGMPGGLDQTIDEAFGTGRLVDAGLILKPARTRTAISTRGIRLPVTSDRQRFEAAVALARQTPIYYKLSDYTRFESMSRPYSTSRSGDLRGTHCSGYVRWAFERQGYTIASVEYSVAVRTSAARSIYDQVRTEVAERMLPYQAFLKPNAPENVANQIVNCFAGLGCQFWDSRWQNGVGSGASSSPDNLLPPAFTLSGTGSCNWGGRTVSSGTMVRNTWGTSSTPFGRVEPQLISGGSAREVRVLTSF